MRPDNMYKESEYRVCQAFGPVLTAEEPWEALRLAQHTPDACLEILTTSGLVGRGGACFPTGLKWKSVRGEANPVKYVVCNSAEGEPGTAANRIIWEQVPEKVICGIAVCSEIIGAKRCVIYLREAYAYLRERIESVAEKCHLKHGGPEIEVFMEPGGYVCGEETALMETIEGRRGEPRLKPPYPTVEGLYNCPTVLNNVETFANIPGILIYGADWFRSRGTDKTPGTKLYTISGPVWRPGVYELPVGVTLSELYEVCGGLIDDELKGIQTGGASGSFVKADQLGCVFAPGVPGISFGVGDVRFIGQSESIPELITELMHFFVDESCGMCIPCKYGLMAVCERLDRLLRSGGGRRQLEELCASGYYISQSARCAMGQAASGCLMSAIQTFSEEFEALKPRDGIRR